MRQLIAAVACALGVLATSSGALAGVGVGVNDDAGKYANGASEFWQTMRQDGLRQNAMTVLWDETRPNAILDESFIRKSLPAAAAAGVDVVFDVYPMHSRALTSDSGNIQRFADFVGRLARTFPSVKQYVVMNECNQTRFVNPQFDGAGRNQSAALCGQALAAAYDTLKAIDRGIFVWGIGLSPRGNDNANARSNVSTSPVKFLGYLGEWYRSSGRTAPIMDGFDFHPYPIPQSLDFDKGYADTDNASVSNLDRIYQAFYDAFDGTGQRTIGQQAGGGLPVSLNEVGIQTDSSGKAGYTGSEASANGNGGVIGQFATEQFQADWYVKMLDLVACDPNVEVVNIFHLVDETDLGAWQSGLYYVGYGPKASAAAVAGWIAQTGGECRGPQQAWRPGGAGADAGGLDLESMTPEQKLDALEQVGVFDGMDTGSVGDPGAFLKSADVLAILEKLFGPSPELEAFTSLFGDPGAALTTFSNSLLQALPQPDAQLASQAVADVITRALGMFDQTARLLVSTYYCRVHCAPSSWASQALGGTSSRRATASAAAKAAPRPVAVGRATVRAGKQARVRMRAVKGAKRGYGRYVLVVRIDSGRKGATKPAAVAVTYTVSKAKAAKPAKTGKKAKHVEKGKHGKPAAHGKSGKQKHGESGKQKHGDSGAKHGKKR